MMDLSPQTIKEMKSLYEDLPEGWTRNHNVELSKAPFLHVNGQESYRHPNREAIVTATEKWLAKIKEENALMINAAASTTTTTTSKTSSVPVRRRRQNQSMIQTLRKMIQAGLPMGAVEQRAKLEGIDFADVLGESKEVVEDEEEQEQVPTTTIIPPSFVKKYRRMIQSGVPLKGVQSKAYLDGCWSPEDIMKVLGDLIDPKNNHHHDQYQPRRHRRERDGTGTNAPLKYFDCADDGSISCQASSLLGSLVRKMTLTVQKRGSTTTTTTTTTTSTSAGVTMQVDSLTLYHALGALQGVQMARDRFNSTCDTKGMSLQEIRGRRQAFVEIAKTIGMELPKELSTKVEIAGLNELVLHIQNVFSKEISTFQTMIQDGWYDFESLSVLYPPGSKVVAKNAGGGGIDMICQVAWNRYEQGRTISGPPRTYFKVCFQYIVAVDASHATMVEVVEGIDSFEGRRDIQSSLNFVPVVVYSERDQQDLFGRYRRRGQIYNQVALCGKHVYMAYQKGSFFLKRAGGTLSSSNNTATALATGGRVIVDTQGAYDYGHSLGIGYDPMVMGIKYKFKEYMLHLRSVKQQNGSTNKPTQPTKVQNDDSLVLFDQVPYDLLDMVWPFVIGFSLTARGWGDILVDGLEDIKWQEDVFDRLVLPENRKTMVKALVRHGSDSFHDLIQGKGEGTVFLLYGPPGCGKTLTAEAVAELLHKPLYSLSLGTLGTTAEDLERRLGEIMTLSARWEALILLDEADSFLETRSSTSSLERNAMVSVMLKLVEYFSGILFLTSNRIDSLDPAFQTRITLALRYEALDKEGRTQVWNNLLIKSGLQYTLDDAIVDTSQLARSPLNGREIKNALRLAMAMAREKNEPLSQDILMETVEVVDDYKIGTSDPYVDDDKENARKNHFCCFTWWK